MAALTCHLDVLASGIPTGVSAILLSGFDLAFAGDVRAFGGFLICHLQFLLFRFPSSLDDR